MLVARRVLYIFLKHIRSRSDTSVLCEVYYLFFTLCVVVHGGCSTEYFIHKAVTSTIPYLVPQTLYCPNKKREEKEMFSTSSKSLKDYFSGWLDNNDGRKREYGSLQDWKRKQKQKHQQSQHRQRQPQQRNARNYKVGKTSRPIRTLPNTKQKSMWDKVKSIFSTEDQDLRAMKQVYSDFKLGPQYDRDLHTRSQVERIAKSEAFRRKLLEKKYDDKRLRELRRGRSPTRTNSRIHTLSSDQSDLVILLQHRIHEMEHNLHNLEKELKITKKKLRFSQEKTSLLEGLLDDANVDDDYVKFKRKITNLQRENVKPASALPPSPEHANTKPLDPLFTSSPIRFNLPSDHEDQEDPNKHKYYSRYPRIPETEDLNKDNEPSLSPIRVDYSKYSSSKG